MLERINSHMDTPLVSIIVPVYNVEKYLNRCICSITQQTYKNIEIILVDDGSADKSGEICDSLAKRDPRVVVIHKENGGLGSARNAGIRKAKGEYLLFVDSDDWIATDTIEYCINVIGNQRGIVDIVQFSMTEACEYPKTIRQKKEKCITLTNSDKLYYLMHQATKTDSFFSACRCLFLTALIKEHEFVEGKINEDIAWKYQVVRDANTLIDSNQIKYFYFQSLGSITTDKLKEKDFDLYKAVTELRVLSTNEEKRIQRLCEVKYARTSLSLLCKMAYYGVDESLDRNSIIAKLRNELKHDLPLLLFSPMKLSRKILAVLFSINYRITENCIKFGKRITEKA